jgi:probable rRNA maturation factor
VRGRVEVITPPELERVGGAAGDLAEAVLAAEGVGGAVVLAFVDEEAMGGLNSRFRGLEEPTDVLSFRQADSKVEWPGPPNKGGTELGEVAVCLAVVRRYAREEGAELGMQLGWTIIHGILHLLGYDHEDDDRMREREQALLRLLERPVRVLSAAAEMIGGT